MILVDTWAWVALADRTDAFHRQAVDEHRLLARRRRKYVTTDFILNETINSLYDALTAEQAQRFLQSLFDSADAGTMQLTYISPDQFRRAWRMRQKFDDKPDISFVDFTSMVVMQDLGITEIFSGDGHFEQVGIGFRLRP